MVALLLAVVTLLAGGAGPALAGPDRPGQDGGGSGAGSGADETTATTATTADGTGSSVTAPPAQDIIPEPNSGHAPEDAGDRGGALQLVVLLLILVGVGVIVTQIVRQARRARERQGTPTAP